MTTAIHPQVDIYGSPEKLAEACLALFMFMTSCNLAPCVADSIQQTGVSGAEQFV